MNSKMTTNSRLSTTEPKGKKNNQTPRTGTESQIRDHMEGYQWGGRGKEWGKRYRE